MNAIQYGISQASFSLMALITRDGNLHHYSYQADFFVLGKGKAETEQLSRLDLINYGYMTETNERVNYANAHRMPSQNHAILRHLKWMAYLRIFG